MDNSKEKRIVRFFHDPDDINLILIDNCIRYGREKRELLCGIKEFKYKKLHLKESYTNVKKELEDNTEFY